MTALTRMHWLNAPAGVAARALAASAAPPRDCATCERFENEAREMQRSHAAETKAAARRPPRSVHGWWKHECGGGVARRDRRV